MNREKAPMWKKMIFVAALTAPLSALAQDPQIVFAALDTNNDGVVTRGEASVNELVRANFDAADANNDGNLSLAEFTAAFGAG
jgi:Ca2+-binding EF-hand superfamily protein